MGARVRLHIEPAAARRSGRGLEIVALANSGYEAEAEELLLPAPLAQKLGWWPKPPAGAVSLNYQTPGGMFPVLRVSNALRVRLLVVGRKLTPCRTSAVIVTTEREAILSAELASRLGIATIDPGRGIWALRNELSRLRKSELPQRW